MAETETPATTATKKKGGGAKKRNPLTAAVDRCLDAVAALPETQRGQALSIATSIVQAPAAPQFDSNS